MKKLLSMVISICIIVSMTASFTATVSAAEPLNIIYKNADADQIDLTFDATIDLTELANYVTLTKDGEPVEIKCDSPDHNFYGSAGNTKTDAAKNVRITPEAGYINQLELDTVYTLTVKAGFSSKDDTKAVTSDIIWSFVVKEIFRDDFESGSLAKWSVGNTANAQIVNTSSLNTGKALSLSSTANGTAAFVSPNSEYFPNDTADYTIKFDYVKNVPCYVSVFSDDVEGQTNSFRLSSNASSQLRSVIWYTAEGAAQASAIEGNTLHTFTENGNKISLKNGTVRAYALRSGKMFFRTYEYNGSSLNGGVFSLRVDSAIAPQYLDNVLVTKVESYAVSTLTVDGGLNNASVDTVVEIRFDYPVLQTEENEECILVSEDGQRIYNYDVTYSGDGKTVYLTFKSDLVYETEYTVEFTDGFCFDGDNSSYTIESHTFTTSEAPFVIESFKLSDGNGEIFSPDDASDSLSVEAKILNRNLADSVTFFATVCLYDSEGRMCAIAGNTYTVAKGETATIADSFELDQEDDYTVKCLVWQSPESMKKLLSKTIE